MLREKGGRAVFLARFTAFLRAVMPGLAGTARMPYRTFLTFNAAGGLIWVAGFTLLAVIVLAVLIVVIRRRRREHDDT